MVLMAQKAVAMTLQTGIKNNGMPSTKRHGFTFIELIVTIAIFLLILATVYSAFSMGLKTWRNTQVERDARKVRLGLLKMQKELKRSFFFSKIPFRGTHEEMVFPLSTPDGGIEKIYVITYSIEVDRNTGFKQLVRKQKVFSEETGKDKEKIKKILPLARTIGLEYAYLSEGPYKNFEWKGFWDGEEQNKLPSGVRISFAMNHKDGIYDKIIFLPQGEMGTE